MSSQKIEKRDSRGLGIFIRTSLNYGIKEWRHTDDVVAWFTIYKTLLGLGHDLYIGCVYIVPEYSTYQLHNEYAVLFDDVASISNECEIWVCGDYNAKTNVLTEFCTPIDGSDGELDILIPTPDNQRHQMIENMYTTGKLVRHSMDRAPSNKHGSRLLEFCEITDMLIFNGRIGDDHGVGQFSRDDTTGRSVVDYAIGTPVIFNQIDSFKVLVKFPESDHSALSISLPIKSDISCNDTKVGPEWTTIHKYTWSQMALEDLQAAMLDDNSIPYYDEMIEYDTDIVANKFDQYIAQACDRVSTKVPCVRRNEKGPAWYDSECRPKRSQAIEAGERVTGPEQKQRQLAACREYRATKQRKQRTYIKKCIDDIKCTFMTNRTDMWRTISRMCGTCAVNEPCDDDFFDHLNVSILPKKNIILLMILRI